MPTFASQILRFLLKLIFAAFAAVFAISLLAVALGVLILSTLKWLVTGKKPAFAVVLSGFQKLPRRGIWPTAPRPDGASSPSGAGQVVDVEAREIRNDQRLP